MGGRSDIETLATAAFARDIGIAEAEGLVKSVLDEIDLSAIN